MPEWNSPIWLLGLTLIPFIWWLHRFRRESSPAIVSALFLWQQRETHTNELPRPVSTDPQWPRRALIVALLITGAAAPNFPTSVNPVIDVWLDDSLSMRTVEEQGSRIEIGFNRLVEALGSAAPTTVRIHSLSHPGHPLQLQPGQKANWHSQFLHWLRPPGNKIITPLHASMAPQDIHWLISDGADPGIDSWLQNAPVSRVLQVGVNTENAAITRLSLRAPQKSPADVQGLATVVNSGLSPARRQLKILQGKDAILVRALTLKPGEIRQVPFTLPGLPADTISAELSPHDSLAVDDDLTIDASSNFHVPLFLTGSCPTSVIAALRAISTLHQVDNEHTAKLHIHCGEQPVVSRLPLLWLRLSQHHTSVHGAPLWSHQAGPLGSLELRATWLKTDTSSADDVQGEPILSADGIPLILATTQRPRTVESRIDLSDSSFANRPEFPLLVAGLLEATYGKPLLNVIADTHRPQDNTQIAPKRLLLQNYTATPAHRQSTNDVSAYFILAALMLLFVDLWRTMKPQSTLSG